ncbi:MAG TPA: hypothetical protein VF600_09950 [Abditibacteriaceae bacterium]|jgi:outer membrane lipoprotein-sorting protein
MNKSSNHMQASPELSSEEQNLQKLFQAADVAAAPSAALSGRVARLSAQHQKKLQHRHSRRRVVRRSVALCGAVTLVLFTIRATPFVMAELFIRRVEAAVSKVHSVHVVMWKSLENGERVRISELWQQGGSFRMESWPEETTGRTRQVQILRTGKLWTYSPKSNKVTVQRQKALFGTGDPDFSGTGIIRELTRVSMARNSLRVNTEYTTANGQPARRIHIQTTGPMESYRVSLLVDDASDLPVTMSMEVTQVSTGKVLKMVSNFGFNRPLQAKLFEPAFPKSVRLLDLDKDKEEWRKRLAKGIASRKVGERTIVIRDVRVNKEGHVFVLYTAGRKLVGKRFYELKKQGFDDFTDWTVESWHDDRGTQYDRSQESPFVPTREIQLNPLNPLPNGFVYNGEKLEGLWLVPLKPQRFPRPTRLTFTMRINPRPWRLLNNNELHTQREGRTVTFTLPIHTREPDLVPDYMRHMNQGPWNDKEVLRAQNRVRHPFRQIPGQTQ